MKMNRRKVAVILAAILILIFGAACVRGVIENKNQYTVMACCEYLENGILEFSFEGESFQYALEKGDRIPTKNLVRVVMDNNGTRGFLKDDSVLKYY